MTLKEAIAREIETLPEQRQADVLAFVRLLKIGLADERTVEQKFVSTLNCSRAIAQE